MIYWGGAAAARSTVKTFIINIQGKCFRLFCPTEKNGAIVHTTTKVPFADVILVAYIILLEGQSNNGVGHSRVKIE